MSLPLPEIETIVAILAGIAAILFGFLSYTASRNNLKIARLLADLQREANEINRRQEESAEQEAELQILSTLDIEYVTENINTDTENPIYTDSIVVRYSPSLINSITYDQKRLIVLSFWPSNPTGATKVTNVKVGIDLAGYFLLTTHTKLEETGEWLYKSTWPGNRSNLFKLLETVGAQDSFELLDLMKLDCRTKSGRIYVQCFVNGVITSQEEYFSIIRKFSPPSFSDTSLSSLQFQHVEKHPDVLIDEIKQVSNDILVHQTLDYLRRMSLFNRVIRRKHRKFVSEQLRSLITNQPPMPVTVSGPLRNGANKDNDTGH